MNAIIRMQSERLRPYLQVMDEPYSNDVKFYDSKTGEELNLVDGEVIIEKNIDDTLTDTNYVDNIIINPVDYGIESTVVKVDEED